MQVLVVLIPVAVIGLIAWIAVGVRQRTAEPFTLASAAALYANLLTILGVTLVLLGGAVAVKVIIGFINLPFAYSSLVSSSSLCPQGFTSSQCPSTPTEDLAPFRTQDLVLAISLIVVGLLAVLIHRRLARSVRGMPGGMPVWVQRGTLLGFALLYSVGAVFGLITAAIGIVGYLVLPTRPSALSVIGIGGGGAQPFADAVGAAGMFTAAWIVVMIMLMRRLRRPGPVPPPVA